MFFIVVNPDRIFWRSLFFCGEIEEGGRLEESLEEEVGESSGEVVAVMMGMVMGEGVRV